LFRLATGGTGVLQPGAIHPDLVARLADEAAKSAQHVLTMCIRALDYCPPVDITFGEFLRAIITADTDAVADDDLHYRVAFAEAFRKRGLYPRDLRTLSENSLVWRAPETRRVATLQHARGGAGARARLRPAIPLRGRSRRGFDVAGRLVPAAEPLLVQSYEGLARSLGGTNGLTVEARDRLTVLRDRSRASGSVSARSKPRQP
ncbi:MAG: hypothetical protein OEW19_08235, partial [Acidobacteriota bacterium]|nr:hypothetical protein [Acidobacteriota bacterium]